MRQYELTVLIHPDLEMNLQPALDKIAKIIDNAGGKITKEVNEGKKRLAYKIKGQEFAVYYYYELDVPFEKGNVKKITDNLDIADEVLRHLLVTVDTNRIKAEARKKTEEDEKADSDKESKEKQGAEEEK